MGQYLPPFVFCVQNQWKFSFSLLSGRRILVLAMVERSTAETWEDKAYVGVCHVLLNPENKSIDSHVPPIYFQNSNLEIEQRPFNWHDGDYEVHNMTHFLLYLL